MGGVSSYFRNKDLDDLLSFETEKKVLIRDRRLGSLKMLLILGVWLYILIGPIILNRGYMKKSVPQVNFEFSLRGPCCNATYNSGNYMSPNNSVCQETCPAEYYTNTQYLSYCSNSTYANVFKGNCAYFDPISLLETTETTALISTRIQSKKYIPSTNPNCNSTDLKGAPYAYCLPQVSAASLDNSYAADIESHSLLMTFSVFASLGGGKFDFQQNTAMKGKVYDTNENIVRTWEAEDTRVGDLMSVGDILKWAGVDLDAVHGDSATGVDTKRKEGVAILLRLNLLPRKEDATSFKYEYSFVEISGESVTHYDSLSLASSLLPLGFLKRRGIKFIVVPEGSYGKFDFPTLLITITSGLTLMKIAVSLVRSIATIFPLFHYRHLYAAAMTDVTMDFSDLGDREKNKTVLSLNGDSTDPSTNPRLVSKDLLLSAVETTMYLYDTGTYRQSYAAALEKSRSAHASMPFFPHAQYLPDALGDYGREVHNLVESRHLDALNCKHYREVVNASGGLVTSSDFPAHAHNEEQSRGFSLVPGPPPPQYGGTVIAPRPLDQQPATITPFPVSTSGIDLSFAGDAPSNAASPYNNHNW